MKYSVFVTIRDPSIRPHQHSFGMPSCALPFLLMLMLSLSFLAGQAWPQCGNFGGPSTTWNNGSGSWNVAGNWTNATPDASTNTCILDGTSTVILDTNGNALGLQLASGNSLNITAAASLSLASGGLSNFGIINNSGTINNPGGRLDNFGTINNSGTINSSLNNSDLGVVTNSGTINIASTEALSDYGTLTNYGVLTNSGTTGISFGGGLTNYVSDW